jgi:diadenosine tetraphosphate (Ap4A) HIT family hydrolase
MAGTSPAITPESGGHGEGSEGASMNAAEGADDCELCRLEQVLFEADEAYVRYDNNSLAPGHVLIVPRRHVASFFEMTIAEKLRVIELLDRAKAYIGAELRPDGYNIGVNVGRAAGQSRMHVHVHMIPRYTGDVADPRGGIRCVLTGRATSAH